MQDAGVIIARTLRVADDLLATAHWNWRGQSPNLVGYQHRNDVSLQLMVSNYCIAIGSKTRACATCHIGYGWVDEDFDFADPANIDCLVCHDTTGDYRKNPQQAGMPLPEVDLVAAAQHVGRPSRAACGSCHFYSGIHHGVVPAAAALGCTDCHSVQAANCVRCHRNAAGMDRPEHMRKVYPAVERRLDFAALGYGDDPALIGGRFFVTLGRGTPPS